MSRRSGALRSWLPIAAVLVVAVIVGWSQMRSTTTTTSASRTPTTINSSTRRSAAPSTATTRPSTRTTAPRSGCATPRGADTIDVGDLPTEARDTLALIASKGPYPYRQDDGVFQNRERVLPKQAKSYYREYTVVTPGSPDRGPRRIIAGDCGDEWYTADHYASFRLIVGLS